MIAKQSKESDLAKSILVNALGDHRLNWTLQMIIIVCFVVQLAFSLKPIEEGAKTEDICQFEAFQPRCSKNEIILVRSATYGRMRIGRCITEEEIADLKKSNIDESIRYLGCSTDVVSILHKKCSGKSECDVRPSEIAAENVKPCLSGLMSYLEVSYDCITAADERRSCSLTVSNSPIHIISSSSPNVLGALCGTKSQPWVVEAPLGKKIRIRLLSFASQSQDNRRETNRCSIAYGIIVDKEENRNTSICQSGQQDTQLTTTSKNKAFIFLRQRDQGKDISEEDTIFILKLQAFGCSDIIPPENTWLKRLNDEILIGCYSSRQTWRLNCREGKWIGVLGNCSHESSLDVPLQQNDLRQSSSEDDLTSVLGIVAIVGFTFAICMVVVGVGIICVRRMNHKAKNRQEYRTLNFQINSVKGQSPESRNPATADDNIRGMDAMNPFPLYSTYAEDIGSSMRKANAGQMA